MMFKTGDKFERSFIVSESVYNGFIKTFGDNNPLHTDDRYAKYYGFTEKVMHGNLLNGFLSFFIGECLPVKNVVIHTQDIQFKNPVYLNDTLLFQAVVSDVSEAVNMVEFKFSFKNRDAKVVSKGKIQIGILT
ncbi:MAG TPA: MaoC/PaaZ C-terminal domain-containing protein [Mucilaginibacter sp.]|jgi:acyl dehydratase|nr:MaoC/PaaZ C-terminal domain-containing protein [Mucilaginibacter sp.]